MDEIKEKDVSRLSVADMAILTDWAKYQDQSHVRHITIAGVLELYHLSWDYHNIDDWLACSTDRKAADSEYLRVQNDHLTEGNQKMTYHIPEYMYDGEEWKIPYTVGQDYITKTDAYRAAGFEYQLTTNSYFTVRKPAKSVLDLNAKERADFDAYRDAFEERGHVLARAVMDIRPDLGPMSLDEWHVEHWEKLTATEREAALAVLEYCNQSQGRGDQDIFEQMQMENNAHRRW